jgi:hypothetical protein
MGAILKIRITDLIDEQPYFGWRYSDGLGNVRFVTFFYVVERAAAFEAVIGADLNQALKDAVDLDLVPGGEYATSIDEYYLYVQFTGVGSIFSFFASNRMVYSGEINEASSLEIEMIQALETGALLNAFNDNVIRFKAGENLNLNTTGNAQLPVTLYPDPTGEYHLNFKDYASTLINQNKFADDILPNIETEGYVYSDLSLFLNLSLQLSDGFFIYTSSFYFLKSVGQIANYAEKNIANNYILLPLDGVNHKVTYYEGYPFDLPVFSNVNQQLTIVNKTTGHSVAMDVQQYTNRLFFSQGSENFTIDDVMPMQSGINRLELQFGTISKIDLVVNKVPSKCAPYFKFYRNSGGFGYIRFEKEVSEDLKTKEGLSLRSDFDGIQNTIRRSITDKLTSVRMEFQTEALELWEMENFKEFIGSPRVEMYVSDLFQRQTAKSWIGVDVKSSTLKSKKLKTERNREQVTVEFDLYNLHL